MLISNLKQHCPALSTLDFSLNHRVKTKTEKSMEFYDGISQLETSKKRRNFLLLVLKK